ncbi:MAG: GMC family oxidoreductase [Deltaproteobacteria bacterium]
MNVKLANSRAELRDRYGIIVIGSGYGGSITAARLAAAGHEVCILERGREWIPGEFPDEPEEVVERVRTAANPLGLYDYRITDDVDVLVGCGLGGTSLINANVLYKPDQDIFDCLGWPDEIRAERESGRLDEYYERVNYMLQGSPIPDDEPPVRKMKAHERSAEDRTGQFTKLNLAVNFNRYDNEPNHVGVYQRSCILCGDCVTGCNVRAKNTLYMNYLPFARNHGAFIFTGIEVNYISKAPGGGYFVHSTSYADDKQGAESIVLHTNAVILAAGTLGSTQILLNSRDRGLAVSEKLGHHFSGNGDILGVGYNNDLRTDVLGFGNIRDNRSKIRVGPTILSSIDYRNRPELKERIVIEEGAFPRALVDVLRYILPKVSAVAGYDTDFGVLDELSEAGRIVRDLAHYDVKGALNHTMVYLGMGHDGAGGVLALDPEGNIRIHWEAAPSEAIHQKISDEMKRLTAALGGTYVKNPRWTSFFGRNLITVHPLGGCSMGGNADEGVVDHRGRVFDPSQDQLRAVHTGLFVADGSILPASVGVNPLFTISALAERIADLLIEDTKVNKQPREGSLPTVVEIPPPVGLEFTEEMKGYFTESMKNAKTPEEFKEAEERGKKEGNNLSFKLTIYIDNVNSFVTESAHEARAEGYVSRGSGKYTVERGRFNLFIEDPEKHTKRMLYSLQFKTDEDQDYLLAGYKEIRDDPQFDVWEIWQDSTTLYSTLYEGKTVSDSVVGQGIIRVHLQDFLKQLTTFRVRNAADGSAKLRTMKMFTSFFFGELWETYVKNLIPELG